MLALLAYPAFLFRKKPEYFYVLDMGGFGVKALLVELANDGKEAVVKAYAHESYDRSKMKGDVLSSPEAVFASSQHVLEALRRSLPFAVATKNVLLGLSGGFVSGKTSTFFHNRENPAQEIDQVELKYILQRTEQSAYEEIRKDFANDTGRSETEVFLFNTTVSEIKIDGYRILSPLNFTGEEISISIFNAFIARPHLAYFMQICQHLGLTVKATIYEALAMHQAFINTHTLDEDALFIDIGGSEASIALTRKGKLENVSTVAVGGNAFNYKLAQELGVGFWEAEHIKMHYSERRLSPNVMKKVGAMLVNESDFLLRGLELVLRDFSQVNLLPSDIYLYGGGSQFSLIAKMLKSSPWRSHISFLDLPQVHTVDLQMFGALSVPQDVPLALFAPTLAVTQFGVNEWRKKEDILSKTVKRMAKIIQG